MTAAVTFLAWVRGGIAAQATGADPLSGPLPARGRVGVGVTVNAWPEIALDAWVHGPGDVTGFDTRQVLRCEPAPDTDSFEPNLFPLVELDRPDLPWLLTPAAPDAQGRLRPWLVLVVVPERLATLRGAGPPHHLGALTCPVRELPDLRESWAWAHAQVAVAAGEDLDDVLATRPERTLSRLVCPRRLVPGERYVACVVPAFGPGRKTGLGLPLSKADEDEAGEAWTYDPAAPDATVTLPVYHSWRFGTGPGGDIEALVRRLTPFRVPAGTGVRDLDVSDPGMGLPRPGPAGAPVVLRLEGMLVGPGTQPSPWAGPERDAFQAALRGLLDGKPGELVPPTYAARYAPARTVDRPRWLWTLSLDPRHRAAAALGTRVVREHQEALVASAWEQAAAVEEANRVLRQGQLAREVTRSLYDRSFVTGLDDERLLQVSAAAHAQLPLPVSLGGSVGGALARRDDVAASVSAAFRRVARPAGPLARRLLPGAPLAAPVRALASGAVRATPELRHVSGLVDLAAVSNREESLAGLTALRVREPVFSWERAGVAAPPAVPLGYAADLLVQAWDYRPEGHGPSRLVVGRSLDFAGRPASWQAVSGAPGGGYAGPAIAAADLDGSGTSDLLVHRTSYSGYWKNTIHTGGYGVYGDATLDADDRLRAARESGGGGSQYGYDIRGLGIAAGDLDGSGRNALVLAWSTGTPPWNAASSAPVGGDLITVGWDVDATGKAAAWSPLVGAGGNAVSVAVAPGWLFVASVRDGRVALSAAHVTSRDVSTWRFRPIAVGGPPTGDRNVSVAIAVADWSGSAWPDLMLLRVEQTGAGTVAKYRLASDVRDGVPTAWGDDAVVPLGGFGTSTRVSIAVADLDSERMKARAALAASFRSAAAATQTVLGRMGAAAAVQGPPPVGVTALASTVRAAVDPDVTVTSRVAARVETPAPPPGGDPLRPLVVAPVFGQPMYEPLRDLDQERLLPGASAVPYDAVTLVATNPRAIEAYLAGLNTEMARELLWRGFPADAGATYFRRFWDTLDANGLPVADADPLSLWDPERDLGANLTGGGGAKLLLLVRGELIRRLRDVAVYAVPGVAGADGVRRPDFTRPERPLFRGTLHPDVVFFGFPFDEAAASGRAGGHGRYFVFQEHPTAPRFGLNEPPKAPTYGTAAVTAWDELDWANAVADGAAYAALRHLPLAGIAAGTSLPETAGGPAYAWARNSAHMAHVTYQAPVQVAVHASDMLP